MSISFNCECGKKLAAKDSFAGRRLKCPGCGRSLTIPAARAVATQLAEAGVSARRGRGAIAIRTSPGFVHFACDDCGRKMRARLTDVGKDIDCPRCGVEMAIPLTDGAAAAIANGGAPVKAHTPPPVKVAATPPPVKMAAMPPPVKVAATPPPVKVAAMPPVTKRIEPMPPLPARSPVAPATTRSAPAPAPMTAKSVPLADPHTSLSTPAPLTDKAAVFPIRGDSLLSQHLTPWRDDEARRRSGTPPPEPKVVRGRWLLPFAVLVVLALLALEWYLVQESHARPGAGVEPGMGPLALIPTKAVEVTTFRVDATDKELRAEAKAIWDGLRAKNFEWSLKDLERCTVILMEPDPRHAPREPAGPIAAGGGKKPPDPKAKAPTTDQVAIIQTRQPYIEQDVLLRVLMSGHGYYHQRVGKRGYWRPSPWTPDRAVYFIDAHTFVFGDIASIDNFVRAQSLGGLPAALETTAEAALKHDFVVGVNLTELTPFAAKATIPALKAFRSAVVTRDDPRDGQTKTRWVLRMTYAKSDAAEAARKSLDEFKIPAESVELLGPTLQVTLETSASDPNLEGLLASVVGIVQRTSALRQRETFRPGPLGPPK
jgi:DNA-directed RNA polymerase subunit RPC12/RpoP